MPIIKLVDTSIQETDLDSGPPPCGIRDSLTHEHRTLVLSNPNILSNTQYTYYLGYEYSLRGHANRGACLLKAYRKLEPHDLLTASYYLADHFAKERGVNIVLFQLISEEPVIAETIES